MAEQKVENDETSIVTNNTLPNDQRPSVRSRMKLVTSFDRTETKLEE